MARYTVRHSYIDIVGPIWMPHAICSLRKDLSSYDITNMRDEHGNITRDSVEHWVLLNSGDFSNVLDFRASIEDGENTIDLPFATEEGETAYYDSLPEED